jgi:hypothetical protein
MTIASRNISGIILLVIVIAGCTSTQKRVDLIAPLRALYAPVHDMKIVVSAGVTLDEYSSRVTDALLKFRNSEDGCNQIAVKLSDPNQKAQAAEVCQHLTTAMDAYVAAKDYFGDTHKTDLDPFEEGKNNFIDNSAYLDLRARFPGLEEVPPSNENNPVPNRIYWRGDVLQALWKLANQESQTAKEMIDRLAQP